MASKVVGKSETDAIDLASGRKNFVRKPKTGQKKDREVKWKRREKGVMKL